MAKEKDPPARPRLVHPVYLDVPMMISFLAALQDGVAFEDTTTRRDSRSTSRDREMGAKVRLPSLGTLLGFDASGRMGRKEQDEVSEETQAVRQHTAASLFNALRQALTDDDRVKQVGVAEDLAGVGPGDVVEIAGEFVGNPLEPVVEFFGKALPYFDLAQEAAPQPEVDVEAVRGGVAEATAEADDLSERAAQARRSGNPARKAEAVALQQRADQARQRGQDLLKAGQAVVKDLVERHEQELGIRMISQVREDLATTPVQDTVIRSGDLQAVLTMSTEFFTEATSAYLRAGVFTAVGKVTRVLEEGDEINLLRRTVLGAVGPASSREVLQNTAAEGNLQLETFDPIIEAPAIQVLPLAVFV